MSRRYFLFFSILFASASQAQTYEQEIKMAEEGYRNNRIDSCIFHFNNAFALGKMKGSDLYNAAICHTVKGNEAEAFALLIKAINAGINISKLKIDPDLDPLHKEKNWESLLKKARKVQRKEFNETQFPRFAKKLAALWESDQYWRFRLGKAYAIHDTVTAKAIWENLR